MTETRIIVTNIGLGHGLIHKPYPEWFNHTVRWVKSEKPNQPVERNGQARAINKWAANRQDSVVAVRSPPTLGGFTLFWRDYRVRLAWVNKQILYVEKRVCE